MNSLYSFTQRALRAALLFLLMVLAGMANAQTTFQVDDLKYSINSDGQSVTVTGHKDGTDATGSLIIPDSVLIEGSYYTVTAIGVGAFFNHENLSGSLRLPNSLTSIGSVAFHCCSGLTGSLTLPNSLTSIENHAFRSCSGFTGSLTIPNSVTSVGKFAFTSCSGFTGSLTLGSSVTSIGDHAFAQCSHISSIYSYAFNPPALGNNDVFSGQQSTTVYVPCGAEEAYSSISWGGFQDFTEVCFTEGDLNYSINDDLVSVTVTGHVDGENATGSLTIPDSVLFLSTNTYYTVTAIGNEAFKNCTKLTGSLTIPNSVTSIGISAFNYCYGFNGSLTIGNSVTVIGDAAFFSCSSFTGDLTIPSSVTSIGNSAFFYCDGFNGSLTIGNSVTSIGNRAFSTCSGFNGSLTIPNSVTAIGEGAFMYCSGFTGSLTIPNSITSIGNSVFSNCYGFNGSLTIPNSVTAIGNNAFYNCKNLTGNLNIPNSVTAIGNSAFYSCEGFTGSLTIPNSVTSIGDAAFANCSGFNGSLNLPNSVTSIEDFTFYNCNNLTGSLSIPHSVISIGEGTFKNCSGFSSIVSEPFTPPVLGDEPFENWDVSTPVYVPCGAEEAYSSNSWGGFQNFTEVCFTEGDLTYSINNDLVSVTVTGHVEGTAATGSLTIPDSVLFVSTNTYYTVTAIGDSAFYRCQNLNGILSIGNHVTSIGNYAFYYCKNLTGSLNIPNSVTSIGNSAFRSCSGFNGSLHIPNSVTTIGNSAFANCSGFTGNLTIPNSVTTIGNSAFSNCSGFNGTLTIPNSVTSIGDNTFYKCSGFTSNLTIPNSVTAIGNSAFSQCSGFTGNLTIPNFVTTIGNNAFNSCSGFNGSLTIGNSVTSIGKEAFYNCSSFNGSLTIPNSVTSIGSGAFQNCSGFNGSLTIGNSVTSIGDHAFAHCSGFNGNLTIPNSVTFIEEAAFNGCSGFTGSLTIPNSVTFIGEAAFYGCSGFTGSLIIPNSITILYNSVFGYCSGFTSLIIPNSVTTIGWNAFYNCTGFTGSLTIPNSVTSIGAFAFQYCSGFTGSLTIPNSVTSIGAYAFSGCSGFTGNLSIPNSVTFISLYAFSNCSGFSSIVSEPFTPPTLGNNYVFQGWSPSTPVIVPCGTKEAYSGNSWGGFSNFFESCPTVLSCEPDTLDLGYRPAGAWMRPYQFSLTAPDSLAVNITDLQLQGIGADSLSLDLGDLSLPLTLNENESVTLGIHWGNQPTRLSGFLTVSYQYGNETGEDHFFLTGEVYEPAEGDVWEMAKIVDNFPYNDTLTVDSIPLFDNYVLPNPNISDGNDVVYLLSIDQEALLSATVDGENGKVFLYEEDFQGLGGPDADNAINGQRSGVSDSIDSLFVEAGTYFLVASSTSDEFSVAINPEPLPCPDAATMLTPANNAQSVNEVNTELSWELAEYTTQYCLCFGTDPNNLDTLVPWTRNLGNQYLFNESLNLNTTYYWQVGERNDGCPDGVFSPAWRFYTTYDNLGVPQNLNVNSQTIFDDETVSLDWSAIESDLFRHYNIYRDGVLIDSTSYTGYGDGPLAYNMSGYFYYVTAVYGPGESGPSDPVTVQVSGRGYVNGFVLDEDGENGIANATITFEGQDEFGVYHTYIFNTNAQGYYSGQVYAGSYSGSAAAQYHQSVNEPLNGNPVAVGYNQTTSPVNYFLNWNRYEIAALAEPDEGGTVTGAGTYAHGNTATLVASQNPAYLFLNWTVNDSVVSTSDTLEVVVTQDSAFVAHFQLNSHTLTITYVTPDGVTAPTTFSQSFTYGAPYSVTSPTIEGYSPDVAIVSGNMPDNDVNVTVTYLINSHTLTITYVTPDGVTAPTTFSQSFTYGAPYSVTSPTVEGYSPDVAIVSGNMPDNDVNVTVTYTINSYTIETSVNPAEGGSVTEGGTYNHFDVCTLVATPNEGYHFVNWTEDGSVVGTSDTLTFVVTGPRTLVANFAINTHVITANADPDEGGTISGTGDYDHFESCTLNASPNEGYIFLKWTKDGNTVSYYPSFSFTVTENAHYVAHFNLQQHTVNASANPAEGGTVSGGGSYQHGATVTLVATPNEGYRFLQWTKDGEVVSSDASFSFTANGSGTFIAQFTLNEHTVSVAANPADGGTVSGGGTYIHGTSATISATKASGYRFVEWTLNGTTVSSEPSFSFTVTEDVSYTANFETLPLHSITVVQADGGSIAVPETAFASETVTVTTSEEPFYRLVSLFFFTDDPDDATYIDIHTKQFVMPFDDITLTGVFQHHEMGDVNLDGELNILDVIATLNNIIGVNTPAFDFELADMNGDGVIDISDAMAINAAVLGLKADCDYLTAAYEVIDGTLYIDSENPLAGYQFSLSDEPVSMELPGFSTMGNWNGDRFILLVFNLNGEKDPGLYPVLTLGGATVEDIAMSTKEGCPVKGVEGTVEIKCFDEERYSIYPVPARDKVVVTGPEISTVEVFNLLGQRLMFIDNVNTEATTVNVSHLAVGCYLFRINTSYGSFNRKVNVTR